MNGKSLCTTCVNLLKVKTIEAGIATECLVLIGLFDRLKKEGAFKIKNYTQDYEGNRRLIVKDKPEILYSDLPLIDECNKYNKNK